MMVLLNEALNTYLQLDPASAKRLKKLENKAISIELLPFHFVFYCYVINGKLTLSKQTDLPIVAAICGTPLQMTAVMLTKENRHRFFADDIKMEGNAEMAQTMIQVFDELHIDWEDYLSQLVGDVPAHHTGRFIKKAFGWLKKTKNTLMLDINDYLHEEKRLYPSKDEIEHFYHDVDELKMAVDRLEAQLRNIV